MSTIIIITRPRPPAQGGGTERLVIRERTDPGDDLTADTSAAVKELQNILSAEQES